MTHISYSRVAQEQAVDERVLADDMVSGVAESGHYGGQHGQLEDLDQPVEDATVGPRAIHLERGERC